MSVSVWHFNPGADLRIPFSPQAASHSLAVSRMMLHLREVAEDELNGTQRKLPGETRGISLVFATPSHRSSEFEAAIEDKSIAGDSEAM